MYLNIYLNRQFVIRSAMLYATYRTDEPYILIHTLHTCYTPTHTYMYASSKRWPVTRSRDTSQACGGALGRTEIRIYCLQVADLNQNAAGEHNRLSAPFLPHDAIVGIFAA